MLVFPSKKIFIAIVSFILLGSFFLSCNFDPNEFPENELPGEPNITVNVSHVSSFLLNSLQNSSDQNLVRSKAVSGDVQSRAFLVGDTIEVTVYDSGDTEINTVTAYSMSGVTDIVKPVGLTAPAGTGYYLTVDVYNDDYSLIDPVVSGTSAPFDVLNGVVKDVEVVCLPVSPIPLQENVLSEVIHLVPTVYDQWNDIILNIGEEQWFSFTPSSTSTRFELIQIENAFITQALIVYDSSGNILDALGKIESEARAVKTIVTVPGETYYIGALDVLYSYGQLLGDSPGDFQFKFYPYTFVPDIYEPNETDAAATTISLGAPQSHTISSDTDVDWFVLDAAPDTTVEIKISSTGLEKSDFWVYLYNSIPSNGSINPDVSIYVENVDIYEPFLVHTLDGAGPYYLKVECTSFVEYDISVNLAYSDGNDQPASAAAVTPDGPAVSASFGDPADVDYFTFTSVLDTSYKVTITSVTGIGINGQILDNTESLQDYLNQESFIIGDGNVFYLMLNSNFGITGNYTVTITEELPYSDGNDSFADALTIVPDAPAVSDNISAISDVDYFTFSTAAGENYKIQLIHDPAVMPYSIFYEVYDQYDNSVTGWNTIYDDFVLANADGGVYSITVSAYESIGDYTLQVVGIAPFTDGNDSLPEAVPLVLSDPFVSGNIESEIDSDYFSFSTVAAQTYSVYLENQTGYFSYAILNSVGDVIHSGETYNDFPYQFDAVDTGPYYVRMKYSYTMGYYVVRVE